MADAPTELLEQIPLFEGLAHGELERISRSFKERRVSAGDTVAAEGAGGVGFFVISEGTASVVVHGEPRCTHGPGGVWVEVARIAEHHDSHTCMLRLDDLTCDMRH